MVENCVTRDSNDLLEHFDVLKQIVTIPGYAVFRHSLGRKALLVYPPLKVAVQFFPAVATQFFTYHCALLCKKVISCDCETEHS